MENYIHVLTFPLDCWTTFVIVWLLWMKTYLFHCFWVKISNQLAVCFSFLLGDKFRCMRLSPGIYKMRGLSHGIHKMRGVKIAQIWIVSRDYINGAKSILDCLPGSTIFKISAGLWIVSRGARWDQRRSMDWVRSSINFI